jgi:hypothetical protein
MHAKNQNYTKTCKMGKDGLDAPVKLALSTTTEPWALQESFKLASGLFYFSEWSAVLDFADELESSFHEF